MRRINAADIVCDSLGLTRTRNGLIDFDFLRKQTNELNVDELERQNNMRLALNQAIKMRNMCLTKQGYIGLVPISAQAGDHVYVLLGGQVLYVLRTHSKNDNNFMVVGECYINGLMDGEVMQWVHDGRASVDDILLI